MNIAINVIEFGVILLIYTTNVTSLKTRLAPFTTWLSTAFQTLFPLAWWLSLHSWQNSCGQFFCHLETFGLCLTRPY